MGGSHRIYCIALFTNMLARTILALFHASLNVFVSEKRTFGAYGLDDAYTTLLEQLKRDSREDNEGLYCVFIRALCTRKALAALSQHESKKS